MRTEEIAKVAHEAVRIAASLHGDSSLEKWHDTSGEGEHAPAWQKDAAHEKAKLQLLNPAFTPQDVHENFCASLEKQGFKPGTAFKDGLPVTVNGLKVSTQKTHPSIAAWSDLPPATKAQAALAFAVTEALRQHTT